jgi:hypothetical protein
MTTPERRPGTFHPRCTTGQRPIVRAAASDRRARIPGARVALGPVDRRSERYVTFEGWRNVASSQLTFRESAWQCP